MTTATWDKLEWEDDTATFTMQVVMGDIPLQLHGKPHIHLSKGFYTYVVGDKWGAQKLSSACGVFRDQALIICEPCTHTDWPLCKRCERITAED